MAVVGRQENRAPGFGGSVQERPQDRDFRCRPSRTLLCTGGEEVVDGIDDDTDNPTPRVDGPPDLDWQTAAIVREVALMEQQRRPAAARHLPQTLMRREPFAFGSLALAGAESPSKQGGARHRSEAREGGERRGTPGKLNRPTFEPAVARHFREQLATDGLTHSVDNDEQGP